MKIKDWERSTTYERMKRCYELAEQICRHEYTNPEPAILAIGLYNAYKNRIAEIHELQVYDLNLEM